jgi:hypothetical protein
MTLVPCKLVNLVLNHNRIRIADSAQFVFLNEARQDLRAIASVRSEFGLVLAEN